MKEHETIYINSDFKDNLKELGLGVVDYISVYKREKDNVYFKAGKGRLHMTQLELAEVRIPSPSA